jgi:hypothetical protein
MTRPFEIGTPETAYERRAMFAVELVDAVTLVRVTQGVKVVAEGIKGKPIVNASGMFVWLKQDITGLSKISIDPGTLPYETLDLDRSDLRLPPTRPALTTIALSPRVDYPFTPGLTGVRGSLIETRAGRVPIVNAQVQLQWLDDGNWRDALVKARTGAKGGDFVSILSLTPGDLPEIHDGKLTVRIRVRRDIRERTSNDLNILQGRVTDPSTLNDLTLAWDELQS